MQQVEESTDTEKICNEIYRFTQYGNRYKLHQKRKSLIDLVDCLKDSDNFPFTSFHFNGLANFEIEEMTNFLSMWGQNIRKLNIDLDDPINNIEGLKTLLLKKVTNVKKLHIQFCPKKYHFIFERIFPSSIQLFDEVNEFQLPKLNVLSVDSRFRTFPGIVEGLLVAACNLKKFDLKRTTRCLYKETMIDLHDSGDLHESITADDLEMLRSANKLHCLKNIRIDLSEYLIDFWENSMKFGDLKLESLAISVEPSIFKEKKLTSSATAIINQLFDSSKEVLHTLAVAPLGWLPGLIIPKMENLKKLELWEFSAKEPPVSTMFPPLFEMADNFPNLKELGKKNRTTATAEQRRLTTNFLF